MRPNFFTQGSPFLQHPLLTPERAAKEVDFVVGQLGLSPGMRVLDVGCGFGRHSLELARRGFMVTGIDPAEAMIAAARERAEQAGLTLTLQTTAAENFTSETPFDAAICLLTTLGQISEKEDNRCLLDNVAAALRPSGQLVVEVPQRQVAVRELVASEQFGDGDRYTTVTRAFDAADNTITETFSLIAPDETRTYRLRYHLFDRDELQSALSAAGFAVTAVFADYDGRSLNDDSPIMIAVGQKGPSTP